MRESRTPGSVRGVLSNGHPYRVNRPDPDIRERQLLGGPLTGTTTPGSPNAISPIGRGTDQKVSLVDPPAAMTVGVRQTMSRKRPGGDTQLPLRGR